MSGGAEFLHRGVISGDSPGAGLTAMSGSAAGLPTLLSGHSGTLGRGCGDVFGDCAVHDSFGMLPNGYISGQKNGHSGAGESHGQYR